MFGALALSLVLAGCGGGAASGVSQAPMLVPDSALPGLLLSDDELNTIMGTSGMTPHPPVTQMGDHRNLLPNLNCLGVWQVNEASIYESSHWKSVRQQMLRAPDTDQWDNLVVAIRRLLPHHRWSAGILHRVDGPMVEVHQSQRQHSAQRQTVARVAKWRTDQDRHPARNALHPRRG